MRFLACFMSAVLVLSMQPLAGHGVAYGQELPQAQESASSPTTHDPQVNDQNSQATALDPQVNAMNLQVNTPQPQGVRDEDMIGSCTNIRQEKVDWLHGELVKLITNPKAYAPIERTVRIELDPSQDIKVGEAAMAYRKLETDPRSHSLAQMFGHSAQEVAGKTYGDQTCTSVTISFDKELAQYNQRLQLMEAAAQEALSWIPAGTTDPAIKAKALFDYVAWQTTYGAGGVAAADTAAYQSLVGKQSTCTGYSNAYCFLLNRAGITSRTVSNNNHEWCMVKIGNNWYHADPTAGKMVTGLESGDVFFLSSDSEYRAGAMHNWQSSTFYDGTYPTPATPAAGYGDTTVRRRSFIGPDTALSARPAATPIPRVLTPGKVTLRWGRSFVGLGATATGYKLFRSTNNDSGFQEVYSGPNNFYEDSNVTQGQTYYYKVRAFNNPSEGVTEFSLMSEVATAPTTISLEKVGVKLKDSRSSFVYNENIDPADGLKPEVTAFYNGLTLTPGTDYSVTYRNNKAVGTGAVVLTGKGAFTGTVEVPFQITAVIPPNDSGGAGDAGGSGGGSYQPRVGTVMYRLYNPYSGEHFYTANYQERDSVAASGWDYEGEGWIAPQSGDPVYRLYSGTDHHYTMDAKERDWLVTVGWSYEGIGWYSAPKDSGKPLYRQFNPYVNPKAARNNSGSHNYTTSYSEHQHLVSIGWKDEGVGWYGL